MATTTPAYSWPVPTSTDLVTNGATAIEALGDAIDASMNTALGTNKAGLVLLSTNNYSAVANAALPDDTFTATYDNYRIIVTGLSTSGNITLGLRMRLAGTNNTAAVYQGYQYLLTASAVDASVASSAATSLGITQTRAIKPNLTNLSFDVINPKVALATSFIGSQASVATGGALIFGWISGTHESATSFDSLSLFPSTGTLSCDISVYGYNK